MHLETATGQCALEIQRTSQLNKSAELTSARDQGAALQLQWANTEAALWAGLN